MKNTLACSFRYGSYASFAADGNLIHVQITSEDSVLQMITRPAFTDLKHFLCQAPLRDASFLIRIPSLYVVAKLEERVYHCHSSDFLAVCKWLATRAEETLTMLTIHNTPEIIADDGEAREDGDWKRVRAKTYLDNVWLMMFRQGAVTACHKYVIAPNTQDSETRVVPKRQTVAENARNTIRNTASGG